MTTLAPPGQATLFQGPLKVGLVPAAGNPNQPRQVGNVEMVQIGQLAAGASTSTAGFQLNDRNGNPVVLPAGAYITGISLDTLVAYGTAATINVGISGTTTKFGTGISGATVGRASITAFTNAQLVAQGGTNGLAGGAGGNSLGTNVPIYVAFAATEAATAATGAANLRIHYAADW